jgi:hypothetical protein
MPRSEYFHASFIAFHIGHDGGIKLNWQVVIEALFHTNNGLLNTEFVNSFPLLVLELTIMTLSLKFKPSRTDIGVDPSTLIVSHLNIDPFK